MFEKEIIDCSCWKRRRLRMLKKAMFAHVGKGESLLMLEMEMIANVRKGDH